MLIEGVSLATVCTLELGGPARYFLAARGEQGLIEALRWADEQGLPVAILGGGSNVVIADGGFPGLVIRMEQRGLSLCPHGQQVLVEAGAGEPWDDLVALTVERGLAGLECLSGIPGRCGATPIQNVGAYGQEVSDTIHSVRVLDRQTLQVEELLPPDCVFGYRDSYFKRHPARFVVLSVRFALTPGGAPVLRYAELQAALPGVVAPTLTDVRQAVLSLRRRKSMVIEPADENRRSVGSFFMNPVVEPAAAGLLPPEAPRFPAADGRIKLAAGWLIEHAGIRKGLRYGHVGVSSRHALALVHHGGGSSAELLALARHVRAAVRERFGVTLQPEPVFLGFGRDRPLDGGE